MAGGPRERIPDPTERARVAAEARAVRDAARGPYRSPHAPEVVISTLPARGKTQLADLTGHLQRSGLAARPDLVHGVYRVPDRISPNLTPHSERGRPVEWAIVHHPAPLPPSDARVDSLLLSREQDLLARRPGEPGVIDEEVALLYCALASIASEDCFGAARVLDFRKPASVNEQVAELQLRIAGVSVLHRPAAGAQAAAARLDAEAPLALGPVEGIHHEILDFDAIRRRIQFDRRYPMPVPSPLPYLPDSPEELLLAYLEVVGVQPGDSYGAQCTATNPRGFDYANPIGEITGGPQYPCADGKPRRRLFGAEHVVLSYRDRPEYAAGRERWRAYQHEVLSARLDHLTPQRPTVGTGQTTPGDRVVAAVNAIADPLWALDGWLDDLFVRRPNPFPYCVVVP